MKYDLNSFWQIKSASDFSEAALNLFYYQAVNSPIYANFLAHLGHTESSIKAVKDISHIPFLPVAFFKNHKVLCERTEQENIDITFFSSGTTGMIQSKHFVKDVSLYENSFRKAFELFYGDIQQTCFLALLPSYLEREGSSLIYMAEDLIKASAHPDSGFFLNNLSELRAILLKNKASGIKTILLGVTYALLDFIQTEPLEFPDLIVMETGGMKGKRKEMIRPELHAVLCKGFGVQKIHSEYGMTELLSQAYSDGDGIFSCPPWMKILLREPNDPLSLVKTNQSGGINIIDLANAYSCAFIATQDLGKLHPDGRFEVLGRFDQSDLRGCNLLVQ